MHSFTELNLPTALTRAIKAMNFENPTPIQAEAIPIALKKHDLIGCAQTGTGKTAAFCIPLISRLLESPSSTGLVLVPTRELGTQIMDVLKKLSVFLPEMTSTLLIGGMSMQPQFRALRRKPRILVATPGRLLDHLKRNSVSLRSLEILVLDEADRMLDMGFAPQLRQILQHLPKNRQTLLFSATLPKNIEDLAHAFLRSPTRITIGKVSQTQHKIQQSAIRTSIPKKNDVLMDELNLRKGSVLVFARTQSRADRVARYLNEFGHQVTRLHGGRTQGQRNAAISGFREGRFRILVATDIAARGIDISHIAHVINYDLPQSPEDYVHRIGRTARAGADGEALSFVTPEDNFNWKQIVKVLQKTGSPVPALQVLPEGQPPLKNELLKVEQRPKIEQRTKIEQRPKVEQRRRPRPFPRKSSSSIRQKRVFS